VQHAADNGAEVVEGYPVEVGGVRVGVMCGHVGTVELFEDAGFQRAASRPGAVAASRGGSCARCCADSSSSRGSRTWRIVSSGPTGNR
jgi:hypothetical protein